MFTPRRNFGSWRFCEHAPRILGRSLAVSGIELKTFQSLDRWQASLKYFLMLFLLDKDKKNCRSFYRLYLFKYYRLLYYTSEQINGWFALEIHLCLNPPPPRLLATSLLHVWLKLERLCSNSNWFETCRNKQNKSNLWHKRPSSKILVSMVARNEKRHKPQMTI